MSGPMSAGQFGNFKRPDLAAEAANTRTTSQPLRMLMTAKEIMSDYSPMDADREEAEVTHPRDWSRTDRPAQTGGVANVHDPEGRYGNLPGKGSYVRMAESRPETDAQLWDRKTEESKMSYEDYNDYRGQEMTGGKYFDIEGALERGSAPQPPSSGASSSAWDKHEWDEHAYIERKADQWSMDRNSRPSLYESMSREGVQKPVHLATEQFSDLTGKPEVLGGHHRIAAMAAIHDDPEVTKKPSEYLPVEHSPSVWHAQYGKSLEGVKADVAARGLANWTELPRLKNYT